MNHCINLFVFVSFVFCLELQAQRTYWLSISFFWFLSAFFWFLHLNLFLHLDSYLWITFFDLMLGSLWVSLFPLISLSSFIFVIVCAWERWYYRSNECMHPPSVCCPLFSVPDRGGVYVCTMHESVSVYVCVRKTMYHRERERVIWEMYDCMCVFVREIMRHRRYYVHDCYIWCMWMWCYVYDCMCNRDGERCECACVLWMLMWTWHHVVYLYVCERDSVA